MFQSGSACDEKLQLLCRADVRRCWETEHWCRMTNQLATMQIHTLIMCGCLITQRSICNYNNSIWQTFWNNWLQIKNTDTWTHPLQWCVVTASCYLSTISSTHWSLQMLQLLHTETCFFSCKLNHDSTVMKRINAGRHTSNISYQMSCKWLNTPPAVLNHPEPCKASATQRRPVGNYFRHEIHIFKKYGGAHLPPRSDSCCNCCMLVVWSCQRLERGPRVQRSDVFSLVCRYVNHTLLAPHIKQLFALNLITGLNNRHWD